MKKKLTRIIPVILVKDGLVVQSKFFNRHQVVGYPSIIIERLSNWNADEIIILDISRNINYTNKRNDLHYNHYFSFSNLISEISKKCFVPLTSGGKIKTLKDIEKLFKSGADKISINSAAILNNSFIEESAKEFGSQAITVSIDCKKKSHSKWEVYINNGKKNMGELKSIVKRIENCGAGEILLNSIHKDGEGKGYDILLNKTIKNLIRIPLICVGGVGKYEHFYECIKICNPSAVAASNIFYYKENSLYFAHKFLYEKKLNVREPKLTSLY